MREAEETPRISEREKRRETMAKMSGIELKSVKYATGMEGDFFQGNVYLDGKKIGFYSEDGNGGSGWFRGDSDGAEEKLLDRIRGHYKKHPEVDGLQICMTKMTASEYAGKKNAGTLPMTDFSGEKDTSFILDVFMGDLAGLLEKEKSYKKGVRKGYGAYVYVDYVNVVSSPVPLDEGYFTDGSKTALEQIRIEADRKLPANEVTVYSSADDFVID